VPRDHGCEGVKKSVWVEESPTYIQAEEKKFRDLHLLVGCAFWIYICFKTVVKHGALWPIFSITVLPVITASFNV